MKKQNKISIFGRMADHIWFAGILISSLSLIIIAIPNIFFGFYGFDINDIYLSSRLLLQGLFLAIVFTINIRPVLINIKVIVFLSLASEMLFILIAISFIFTFTGSDLEIYSNFFKNGQGEQFGEWSAKKGNELFTITTIQYLFKIKEYIMLVISLVVFYVIRWKVSNEK
jgi:hypothetical protein